MELLNTYQVAKMLGVGETTIKRWRDSGKLASVDILHYMLRKCNTQRKNIFLKILQKSIDNTKYVCYIVLAFKQCGTTKQKENIK